MASVLSPPVKIKRTIYYEIQGLGQRIKAARKASPKSMTSLAAEAGMSAANWYRIESEDLKDGLPEETLAAIESALGVSFRDVESNHE